MTILLRVRSWLFGHQRTAALFVGATNTLNGFLIFAGLQLAVGEIVGYVLVLLMSHVASVL